MWFVCVNLRDQREILGFLLCGLIEYSYVNILPQITQITQRNAASCIITQRKTDWGWLLLFLLFLLFWVSSAIICGICERHWGFFFADRLSTLACYSPADSADHAEECSRLHYYAEKDSLVIVVLGFVCDNLRDLRETLGFLCADRLSTLACILPQITQITQRNAAGCIITQRKTVFVWLMWFCCFGVCLRLSA